MKTQSKTQWRSLVKACGLLAAVIFSSLLSGPEWAFSQVIQRDFANVPPEDEIEILDPNVDELGRPAVELVPGKDGGTEVVVPQVVLVHKYYYNGDRSFQAQMLPGGPTIIVANHPRTGERFYIETNMLPGAPRVTYTSSCMIYDYDHFGMKVHFPIWGTPKVSYRSGRTVTQQVGRMVHAEQWKEHAANVHAHAQVAAANTAVTMKSFAISTGETVGCLLLPVKNVVRLVPFGTAFSDPERIQVRREKIAEHERAAQNRLYEKQRQLSDGTYRTIR